MEYAEGGDIHSVSTFDSVNEKILKGEKAYFRERSLETSLLDLIRFRISSWLKYCSQRS